MRSLTANLIVFVGLPLCLNGVIFGLGWQRTSPPTPGLPPGWVVGALWLVLFAGMGVARWLLLLRAASTSPDHARPEWVTVLAFLCLIYPLYTAGLQHEGVGFIGNLITLVVALAVAAHAWRRVKVAGVCVAAVCCWLVYAAAATAYGILL
jgi:benzodiazapine receptor